MGPEKESKEKINKFKRRIVLFAVLLLFFVPLFCEIAYHAGLFPHSPSDALLKAFGAAANNDETQLVEFFYVGQGDCTIIKSRDKTAIIDFGTPDESDALYNRLKQLGIDRVELAVVTHNDSDHLGGFISLIENTQIDCLLINDLAVYTNDSMMYNEAIRLANNYGTAIYHPKVGGKYQIGEAQLEIVYSNPAAEKENNRSIVTMLTMGGKRILLTGDIEGAEENKLLTSSADLNCDILKLAHHGSNTSTGYELLRRTTPKVAVASSGYDNLYNHPADGVVSRLNEFEIPLYRTDLDKTVRITFENNSFRVTNEREGIE